MRLSCAVVSRILGSRIAGEPVPGWVEKHLEECVHCQAEAEQLARIGRLVEQSAYRDRELELSWQSLRSTLPARNARPVRTAPVYVFSAAAVVVVLMICFGLTIRGVDKSQPQRAAKQSPTLVRHKEQAPNAYVARSLPEQQPARVQTGDIKRAAKVLLVGHELKPGVKRHHMPVEEVAPSNDQPAADVAASPTTSDEPDYKLVGAEEHVINVVGVDSSADPADSNTKYVIQTTDTGDDHQVVML